MTREELFERLVLDDDGDPYYTTKEVNWLMDEFAKQEAIAVLDFANQGSYISTTLPHENPQLWQKLEYPKGSGEHFPSESEEITSEQLYNLFLQSKKSKV